MISLSRIAAKQSPLKSTIRWGKRGKKDGNRGVKVKLLSKHIKRFMLEKHKEKCSRCGWSERHKTTGAVPLEIDHINGILYTDRTTLVWETDEEYNPV